MKALLIVVLILVSCASNSPIREVGSLERAPAGASVEEQVDFYVARLGDKDYYENYSTHEEIPFEWYVAAEELGMIGLPAIPALIEKLEVSTDVYERQQIFWALRLAVQARQRASRRRGKHTLLARSVSIPRDSRGTNEQVASVVVRPQGYSCSTRFIRPAAAVNTLH